MSDNSKNTISIAVIKVFRDALDAKINMLLDECSRNREEFEANAKKAGLQREIRDQLAEVTEEISQQTIESLSKSYNTTITHHINELWERIDSALKAEFSQEEIEELNEIFSRPVMQKLVDNIPEFCAISGVRSEKVLAQLQLEADNIFWDHPISSDLKHIMCQMMFGIIGHTDDEEDDS